MEKLDRVLLTVPEACDYLRISRATLYRHIKQGKITPIKIGRRTLIDKSDLDRLIEEGRKKQGEDKGP